MACRGRLCRRSGSASTTLSTWQSTAGGPGWMRGAPCKATHRLAGLTAKWHVTAPDLYRPVGGAFVTEYVSKVVVPELYAGGVRIPADFNGEKGKKAAEPVKACGANSTSLRPDPATRRPRSQPARGTVLEAKQPMRRAERRTHQAQLKIIGGLLVTLAPDACASHRDPAAYS
jgi:hypothetical protein